MVVARHRRKSPWSPALFVLRCTTFLFVMAMAAKAFGAGSSMEVNWLAAFVVLPAWVLGEMMVDLRREFGIGRGWHGPAQNTAR